MTIGLALLGTGVILLVLSLALGDIVIKIREIMLSVKKLARNEPFRLVILVLGTILILAGGSVLVRAAVQEPTADGGAFAKTTTTAYSGPSTQGYDVSETVPVNTRIRVIAPPTASRARSRAT